MRACFDANLQSRLTADRRGRLRVDISCDDLADGYARELLRNVERVLDCYRDPGVRIEEYHPVPEGSKVPAPGNKLNSEYAGLEGTPSPSGANLGDNPLASLSELKKAPKPTTRNKPANTIG